jgi:hypothetical protein
MQIDTRSALEYQLVYPAADARAASLQRIVQHLRNHQQGICKVFSTYSCINMVYFLPTGYRRGTAAELMIELDGRCTYVDALNVCDHLIDVLGYLYPYSIRSLPWGPWPSVKQQHSMRKEPLFGCPA